MKVEHVDAVVPGDALGLDLAEELQSLRPFGMGNPAINVLVPAAKVSDVRPMGTGGRHVRFSVTSGGLRSRAVGFGIAPGSGSLGDDEVAPRPRRPPRGERVAGLRRATPGSALPARRRGTGSMRRHGRLQHVHLPNGRRGVVETRPGQPTRGPSPHPCELPNCRTANCSWTTATRAPSAYSATCMTTGESVLVLCADVSRRAAVLSRDLDSARFARRPVGPAVGTLRCRRVPTDATDLVLADHAGACGDAAAGGALRARVRARPPGLGSGARAAGAAAARDSCTSGWGPAEVEFTRAVVEHQHRLRAPSDRDLPGAGVPGPARVPDSAQRARRRRAPSTAGCPGRALHAGAG